jgi:replicative DNA helicase Mcm
MDKWGSVIILLSTTNNKNNHYIKPTTLISLYELGFKLVPLSENHRPVIEWSNIYDNIDYWKIDKFNDIIEYSKFKNVAATLGKSHIKDSKNNDLFIQVLDVDSEHVYNILSKPIVHLNTNPILKSRNHNFICDNLGIAENEFSNLTLIDAFKKCTYVTKTRKPYGFHIWWLSHNQNKSISSKDCKIGYEFEIKTDKKNGLCTLPPSTHRDDKDFRYSAVGRADQILINDNFYELFNELFKDHLIQKDDKLNNESENFDNKDPKVIINPISFYNLSSETIDVTASILAPFYIEYNRNNFLLPFSGYTHNCRISEDSAGKIISELCKRKEDKDIKERLITLHCTYEKASNGRPISGGPTLVDLMSKVKGCNIEVVKNRIKLLKDLWRNDINLSYCDNTIDCNIQNDNDYGIYSSANDIISVSKAKMLHEGRVKLLGKIMTCSSSFKMISATNYRCSDFECNYNNKVIHPRPLLLTNDKESNNKCPNCSNLTVSTTFDYINAIELELQDVDKVNEIDRLLVYLFEDNIQSIKIGETVYIDGNIAVINKNDNKRKKLIAALYGNSITYENEKEIILTQKDVEEIVSLKTEKREGWIDCLVSKFAPNIAWNYYPKLSLLLAAVNSGPDEIFRKRDRIHVLLVGEPGLAKTKLLEDAIELVPNSKYMSMSNTSGISLTAMIEKDEVGGGGYSVRAGSIVLAKNAIFAANEIGDLNFKNQLYLGDIMEEGVTHISKYTIDARLVAPVTMIAACNPTGTYWKNHDRIEATEIPLPPKEIDRYDLQFFLRMPREKKQLKAFVSEIAECDKNYPQPVDYTFLKKVILYSKQFKPKLSEEVITEIQNYWIEVASHRGSVRVKNVLERLAKALAKLRFKNVVDIDDANDAIGIYKHMISQFETFDYDNTIPKNPQYVAADVCAEILKNNYTVDKRVDDLIDTAIAKNLQVAAYFSGEKKIKTSYKARAVRDILLQNPNIKQIGKNPVTLQWFEPFKHLTTITDANPTNLDHYAKNDQITPPSDGIESTQGDEGNVSNVIQKQIVAKCNDDNLPNDIEQTIDVDEKEEINNKNSTLPSLHSSPSGIALLEDNSIVQNNNIDPKQIRIQINHSKAADIETNDDFELSK